jgi:uncharacterized protein YdhG (YjbR/CyaY superfamily)
MARRLLKNEAPPQEGDGYARETDAGNANSSAIGATEDTLSGRPVPSGGRGFVLQQPPSTRAASSIDEYIAGFPSETRRLLEELRALIQEAAPEATERISYRMATFDLHGRPLIYFAGFQGHVGLYPVIGAVAETLEEELRPYKSGKGTLRFELDRPLPAGLVRRIVELKRLLRSDASPQECAGDARETDAGSANSSAIGATEDTVSRRPARSGGRDFASQRPEKAAEIEGRRGTSSKIKRGEQR